MCQSKEEAAWAINLKLAYDVSSRTIRVNYTDFKGVKHSTTYASYKRAFYASNVKTQVSGVSQGKSDRQLAAELDELLAYQSTKEADLFRALAQVAETKTIAFKKRAALLRK